MTFSVTSKRKEKPDLQRCFNHCYQQMVLWTYQQNVALPDSIHLTYDGAYKCIDLPANFDEPDSLPAPMHPSVVEAHHRLLEREVQLQRLDGGRLDLNLATQRLNQRPRTTCCSMSPIQLASGTPAAMKALEKKEAYIDQEASQRANTLRTALGIQPSSQKLVMWWLWRNSGLGRRLRASPEGFKG